MLPIAKRVWISSVLLVSQQAFAYVTNLPQSLAPEVLSETVPTAFAGFDLKSEDYTVEWVGRDPGGVALRVIPGTVQWVRVADVLALPRARLGVEIQGAQAGRIANAGFMQPLVRSDAEGPAVVLKGEIPVALMSGERNPIEISFLRGGQTVTAQAVLRFVPRESLGNERVFFDASCSRFGLEASGVAQSSRAKSWAYVGCRVAEVYAEGHRTSSLEAWVYWDGVGQNLLVSGVPTLSSSASVWPLRLRSEPGSVQLAVPPESVAQGVDTLRDEMTLRYRTPEYFHRGFVGLGIGPYWYNFSGNGEYVSTPAPVLTLYGSYFVTESLRGVVFGAATLGPHLPTDIGIYVNTEYVKFLDRRIVVNLLLGGHAIGYISRDTYYLTFSLPQGVEVIFNDFLARGFNLNSGFFLYPLIKGVSYYNVWLRWGSGKVFGEFNYISWDQPVNEQPVHSDSAGISVGFPLARFL